MTNNNDERPDLLSNIHIELPTRIPQAYKGNPHMSVPATLGNAILYATCQNENSHTNFLDEAIPHNIVCGRKVLLWTSVTSDHGIIKYFVQPSQQSLSTVHGQKKSAENF